MNNWGNNPFGIPLQGIPLNVYNHQNPFSVFPLQGQGFSSGQSHLDLNNNVNFNVNQNNDIRSPAFPFHPHLHPPLPAVNVPSHPPINTQQSSSSFNPFSVNHLQTQRVPPVVTGNTLGSAEQPSTSFGAPPPGHRDYTPIGQPRVCFLFIRASKALGVFSLRQPSLDQFLFFTIIYQKVKFLVLEFK